MDRYEEGYKQGVIDTLSTMLNEYDNDQHVMIMQHDGIFAVAKKFGVDLVKEIKEQRYKMAAEISGHRVEQLKAIDAEGPECESGLPVYECILQRCPNLEYCHFKIKEAVYD